MEIIPNSLTKKARINLIAQKATSLAKEIENYFFGREVDDPNDEVNVKEILGPIKEDTASSKPDFQGLSRQGKTIAMLSRHLRVVGAILRRLNDNDENVNELLKSAGI